MFPMYSWSQIYKEKEKKRLYSQRYKMQRNKPRNKKIKVKL